MNTHWQNNFKDIALLAIYLIFVVNGLLACILLKDHNFVATLFIASSVGVSSLIVAVYALFTFQWVRKLEDDIRESGISHAYDAVKKTHDRS